MLTCKKIGNLKKQAGFTLMEVMIASFILAVGMLGSTGMMLRGHQEAKDTNYEAVAVQLAQNMAERMRSNIRGVETNGGAYNAIVTTGATLVSCTTKCDPANLAAYHTYIWSQEVATLLPASTNPVGRVTLISPLPVTNSSVFSITIEWDRSIRRNTIDADRSNTYADSASGKYEMIFQP